MTFYSHAISIVKSCFTFNKNFGMPEFLQNCLDCTTNSLSNLNDANSNSNLRCGNSTYLNEGILSFFKNLVNSSFNTSGLVLLVAFLVARFRGGGVGIKLFGMFSKTDGGSLGLDFLFIVRPGKLRVKCLTQTILFGISGIFSLGMAFIYLCRSSKSNGSRYTATFPFSER